jgi:hypothetical protein
MPLNSQEIGKILTDHLDTLTTEEFMANLKEFCPYLFEEDYSQSPIPDRLLHPSDNPVVSMIEKTQALSESANLKK